MEAVRAARSPTGDHLEPLQAQSPSDQEAKPSAHVLSRGGFGPFARELLTPQALRQLVVLREVLDPPVALRDPMN